MKRHIESALAEAAAAIARLQHDQTTLTAIEQAGQALADALAQGGHVYSCGNGGSMCDAMHFAEELSGRFRTNRRPLGASAISDPSYLTCVANDFGYEYIFSRFIEGHGRQGDVLLAISTSGTSQNIVRAAQVARDRGMTVIALTGKPESTLSSIAHYDICTPAGRYADRVQELHIKVIHILVELVERELFPENYEDVEDVTVTRMSGL